jgi:hypothetical protein
VRGPLQLRSSHLVALQAELRLRLLYANMFRQRLAITLVFAGQIRLLRVSLSNASVVHLMTIHAGHGARLMRASRPEHLVAFGMAGKAGGISFFDRGV